MKIDEIRQKFPMYSDIPDGDLVRGIHNKFYSDIPYADFLKKIDFAQPVNPTEGMSGTDKFLSGAGKAFIDLGRGAKQLGANVADAVSPREQNLSSLITGPQPSRSQELYDKTKEQRQLDAPLMKTGAGLAGNITGNIAATLPALAVPGVNTYTGAAALGGVMGALQPSTSGNERLVSTGLGAGTSVAGQALGNALSRAVRPIQSTLAPEEQRLAAVAAKEGIPLDAAAATGSKPLKTINSVFENLPFTAGKQAEQGAERQAAFNAAVLKRAGISGDSAVPEVLASQKQALGKTFEDIAGRNAIDFNKGPVTTELADIAKEAGRRLANKGSGVTNTIDDLLSEVGTNGLMEGAKYQGWRSELGRLARGTDSEAHYFGQVKKALDKAFSSQVSAADSAAWKQASSQYGNLKTILNSMGGAGEATTSGNIAPTQLAAALRQSVGKEGVALGRGGLNDVARVGTKFVRDNVPNSGTAQRLLYQSLLTGGGAGIGAGGAAATGHDPIAGAAYGAAGMGASLIAPRLAQSLLQSGPVQSYMINQAASPTAAALAKALQAGGRGLGASVPSIYGSQQ